MAQLLKCLSEGLLSRHTQRNCIHKSALALAVLGWTSHGTWFISCRSCCVLCASPGYFLTIPCVKPCFHDYPQFWDISVKKFKIEALNNLLPILFLRVPSLCTVEYSQKPIPTFSGRCKYVRLYGNLVQPCWKPKILKPWTSSLRNFKHRSLNNCHCDSVGFLTKCYNVPQNPILILAAATLIATTCA